MWPVVRQMGAEIKYTRRARTEPRAIHCTNISASRTHAISFGCCLCRVRALTYGCESTAVRSDGDYMPGEVAGVVADTLQGLEDEGGFHGDFEVAGILHRASEEAA